MASVRAYGADRLAAADQEADGRRRHARRYLRMARSFLRHLLDDDQPVRLRELRAEHGEITAALEHGFAAAEPIGGGTRPGSPPRSFRTGSCPDGCARVSAGRTRSSPRRRRSCRRRGCRRPGSSAEAASALASRAVLGTMLGVPEAVADAREAIAAGRTDRRRARRRLGHLALQLALGLGGAYQESSEAAGAGTPAPVRARARTPARRCLDVQLGLVYQLGRGLHSGGGGGGQRALAGLGPGERWLHGYVRITSALALYRQPGRRPECADAAGEALRAMHDLGDAVGAARALDVLGWLAADDERFERSAWLLGAAQARWEEAGGRRGGHPGHRGHRALSAAAAALALRRAGRYAELRARGADTPIEQIIAVAVAGDAAPPSVPAPRAPWG